MLSKERAIKEQISSRDKMTADFAFNWQIIQCRKGKNGREFNKFEKFERMNFLL